jgi:hypothetical protein
MLRGAQKGDIVQKRHHVNGRKKVREVPKDRA